MGAQSRYGVDHSPAQGETERVHRGIFAVQWLGPA